MARPCLAMRKIREILRLAHEGLTLRQIGAALGVPFTTVGDHVRRAHGRAVRGRCPTTSTTSPWRRCCSRGGPAPVPDRPLPDWSGVHRELRRPGVTLMLVWHEYRGNTPTATATASSAPTTGPSPAGSICRCARSTRPARSCSSTSPGRRLPIYDRRSGEVAIEAELFVAVLGASNYLYAEAIASQRLEHWIGAHVHCLRSARARCPGSWCATTFGRR